MKKDRARQQSVIKAGDVDVIGYCPFAQADCEFIAHDRLGGDGIFWAQAANCVMAVPGVGCGLADAAKFMSRMAATSYILGGEGLPGEIPLVPVTVLRNIPDALNIVCGHCERPMKAAAARPDRLGDLVCAECWKS